MKFLLQALEHGEARTERRRFPIRWSEAKRRDLLAIAEQTVPGRSPADPALAACLIQCADGQFSEADERIATLAAENWALIARDNETLISFLNATYTVQRFDLVTAILRDRYGYGADFEIDAQEGGPGRGCVRWDVFPSGSHRFTFDAASFEHDNTRTDILTFQWGFPLYANYSRILQQEAGSVIINQGDIGFAPGLAWCDNRPDYFLVPDCIFVPTKGYQYVRDTYARTPVAWHDKKSVAFWRGATTGVPQKPGDWMSLERLKLCQIAQQNEHRGFVDIGISVIHQIDDPAVVKRIQEADLVRGFVAWQDWPQYKYLVDIDGNSSPWSNLFQRL